MSENFKTVVTGSGDMANSSLSLRPSPAALTSGDSFDAAVASLKRGVNVVEASAGTGKTYAIAMLVLRFVVEYGVPVEELLVVSYTRAATEELRSRIRSRLLEARELLAGTGRKDYDPVLRSYVEALPDKERSRSRLELALLDMDRAAIFTIHGFCQRMLREQALESGQLFDMELTSDISKIRTELVADYWRNRMYGMGEFHCSLFLDHFTSPAALYATVKGVAMEDRVEPVLEGSLAQVLSEVDTALEELRDWWQDTSGNLKEHILAAIDKGMLKKGFCKGFDDWWRGCEVFLGGAGLALPSDLACLGHGGLKDNLNGNRLRGDAKKDAYLEPFPLAGQCLTVFLRAVNNAVLAMRSGLVLEIQNTLRERLLGQGRFSFDDLVLSLARALEGPRRDELRRVVAGRFRVALIDEFQDTDSAQYRIFSILFAGGEKRHHFLYLIGDPKQAIYRFRGADIAAYFKARDGADTLLGLARNYRSNPQLVEAVNRLFQLRQDENAFVSPEIHYQAVRGAKAANYLELQESGVAQAAMVYCSVEQQEDGKAWTTGKLRHRLESSVVEEIVGLLGAASFDTGDGELRAVEPADIAILVRTNKQAESFQEALVISGIPAVVYSKKTVYETAECQDLLRIVQAVTAHGDIRCLAAAMSCRCFGLDGPRLYRILQTEEAESWMERFHGYALLWQEKGFLVMMNHLFSRESLFENLGSLPLAERRIANFQHLTQLLQEEESRENLHQTGLVQFLEKQMETAEQHEEAQLRLESDKDAVKVVTMHAVKGLEYPIVFCPYLWYRPAFLKQEKSCVRFHDHDGGGVADLGSSHFQERHSLALQEELAEEARLLYVAVTRASGRCYVYWANVQGGRFSMTSKDSALAWVLSFEHSKNVEAQEKRFLELENEPSVAWRRIPAQTVSSAAVSVLQGEEGEDFSCPEFSRTDLGAQWLMTSYSSLAGSGNLPIRPQRQDENDTCSPPSPRIHTLPLGAGLGNVVHGLLEDHPFAMLAVDEEYGELCQAQCHRFGVTAESDSLMALLRDVTISPLLPEGDGDAFRLMDIAEGDVLKEMPFYFHLQEGSTRRINELLHFSPVVQDIQEKGLKGYLIGFIDLVCRHDGKYYIMDYKTNFLGHFFCDYSRENLDAAMYDHNYGLQYWIYSLVLDRYLRATLADYDYQQHFGGVFYLFARGMRSDLPGNGCYFHRPDPAVLGELYRCLGAGNG